MNLKISIAVFLLTTASALMFLPLTDDTKVSAQTAGLYFTSVTTPKSAGQVKGDFTSIPPTTGFFTPFTNSSFTLVSTSTASTDISRGVMTCSGAACVNVSPTCQLSLIYTRDAKYGDTGIDVVALQKFLESSGFLIIPDGTTYGYMGSKTLAALSLYQATAGLPPTGYLDSSTRQALNSKVYAGRACYDYVRYDSLQFNIAAKAKHLTVASDLNSIGITGSGNKPFCSTSYMTTSCFNLANENYFIGYLPGKTSAVRSALYLATLTNLFSLVDYVPSDPQTALGSIVFISKSTTHSTTTVTTTYSPTFGTSTATTTVATSSTSYTR